MEYLKNLKLPNFVKIVESVLCKGKEHLNEFSAQVLAKGGEGVILREPGSLYIAGRSPHLRKYKPFLDTEVKVVQNQYPHGLKCEQYVNFIFLAHFSRINGKSLFVPIKLQEFTENVKKMKPGAVITVKHGGVNVYGTLQFPQFYRERTDVKWDDLIKS